MANQAGFGKVEVGRAHPLPTSTRTSHLILSQARSFSFHYEFNTRLSLLSELCSQAAQGIQTNTSRLSA
eukprot:2600223-Pyramimonas_sp.AAC.2